MKLIPFSISPIQTVPLAQYGVAVFATDKINLDPSVVESFGREWNRFNHFTQQSIEVCSAEYFDLLDEHILTPTSQLLDAGCGSGRFTGYLSSRAGFIEAIDPSDAIFSAAKEWQDLQNVRFSKASIGELPFADESFDLVLSVGVLHHIPNTQQALNDCVAKVKKGGWMYCYLYHNLEMYGPVKKSLYFMSEWLRKAICKLPHQPKQWACDALAVGLYLPIIGLGRLLRWVGCKKWADQMPLSGYHNKTFFIIRNDALDKFGTALEQRFSRAEVVNMMQQAGLTDIKVSPLSPYYHAIGRKL